jgi:hypothetical protein
VRRLNLDPAVGCACPLGGVGWDNRGLRSGGVESNGRFELPAVQVMSQCFTEDAIAAPERVQLLRTLSQSGHEAGDTQIGPARQMLLAVRAADRQPHLAGMVGSPRQGGEQERPAGYRLSFIKRFTPCVIQLLKSTKTQRVMTDCIGSLSIR